jgi:hypothetical protein
MVSAGRERGKEVRRRPVGVEMARKAKKILNRGNELKDLLQTQGLADFLAKNELKTNSVLSAKMRGLHPKSGF